MQVGCEGGPFRLFDLPYRRATGDVGMGRGMGLVFLINGPGYDHERVDSELWLIEKKDCLVENNGALEPGGG